MQRFLQSTRSLVANRNQAVLPILAFIFLGIVWGSNFIYMKMAVELVTPMQVVLIRVVAGFLLVAVYAWLTGAIIKAHLRHIGHFFVMSMLATVIYYFGFVKATQYLPSGIAGAVSAVIPLFSLLFALLFLPDEKLSIRKLLGILVGFLGVIVIADPFAQLQVLLISIKGVAWIITGAICVGGSFVYAKKFLIPLNIPAAALTSYQLGIGTLLLLLSTDLDGITAIAQKPHVLWGSVIGLGILGTGVAYLLYYFIIREVGAVRAASATYLPPIVAMIIGSVIVGEAINAQDYVGVFCIMVGVYCLSRSESN